MALQILIAACFNRVSICFAAYLAVTGFVRSQSLLARGGDCKLFMHMTTMFTEEKPLKISQNERVSAYVIRFDDDGVLLITYAELYTGSSGSVELS